MSKEMFIHEKRHVGTKRVLTCSLALVVLRCIFMSACLTHSKFTLDHAREISDIRMYQ